MVGVGGGVFGVVELGELVGLVFLVCEGFV